MYPVLFQNEPFTIYSLRVLWAVAAVCAAYVVRLELKRYRLDPELASSMVFAAAAGGFVGARLLFILEEWHDFLRSPWHFIFSGAGFSWYGGLIGGTIAVTWWVRRHRLLWLKAADIGAPALALGYGVGRIGCQVAGAGDWGVVTDVQRGVAYTSPIVGWVDPNTGIPYPPGVRVHPPPIYEFIEAVIVFVILASLRKRAYARARCT